jgi:hypothetical protein
MKANELRIGNLVMYDGRVFEIDTIAKEFPTLNTIEFGIGVVDWMNINPIPLTKEWLLKFGFYKSDNYGNDEYRLDGYSYFRGRFYISDCDECGEDVEINFVHELQNLYFALTKKELTIM